jgi:hypothetical protein
MRWKLIAAGPVEPCEGGCGSRVRVAQYEGGKPRLNRVCEIDGDVYDMPGGHSADDCRHWSRGPRPRRG